MTTLEEAGERRIVEALQAAAQTRSKNVRVGIGDDAAVIRTGKDTVICTDIVGEKRHKPEGMNWQQFGWTSAAVCFSDIAAMGARPTGFLPSITAPGDMELQDLVDIISGIDQCCEYAKTSIIGGDTKPGELSVAGTAIGDMEGRSPMVRSGARPGDMVALVGNLGEPAAGFASLSAGIEAEAERLALYVPVPLIKEGVALAKTGAVTSCIDLSDGLATAASEVCKASRVGMTVVWDFLPIGPDVEAVCAACGADLEDSVLRWGGEYALLFTFRKDDIEKLYETNVPFSIIGTVDDRGQAFIQTPHGEEAMGYGKY